MVGKRSLLITGVWHVAPLGVTPGQRTISGTRMPPSCSQPLPTTNHQLRMGKGWLYDDFFAKIESIIFSMTPEERADPALLNMSRKQRIAKGSGVNQAERFHRLASARKYTKTNFFGIFRGPC